MDVKPRLLDQVRERIKLKHYSYRTEKQCVGWIRRYFCSMASGTPLHSARRK